MATLAELETQIQLLNQRMTKLATASQVSTLQTLLNDYKSDTDALITTLRSEMDTVYDRLQDLEARVQALEP